jgi:hypothetical protein
MWRRYDLRAFANGCGDALYPLSSRQRKLFACGNLLAPCRVPFLASFAPNLPVLWTGPI